MLMLVPWLAMSDSVLYVLEVSRSSKKSASAGCVDGWGLHRLVEHMVGFSIRAPAPAARE